MAAGSRPWLHVMVLVVALAADDAANETYAPSEVPESYEPSPSPSARPSAAPSLAPTQSYALEALKCYDKVELRGGATDLYCDQRDPADCRDLFVQDCVEYCRESQIMALTSNGDGSLVECYCAKARPVSCIRVSGMSTAFDVASLSVVLVEGEREFEGVCVMAEEDVGISEVCPPDHGGDDEDEDEDEADAYPPTYAPSYRPSYAPTAGPGGSRAPSLRPSAAPAAPAAATEAATEVVKRRFGMPSKVLAVLLVAVFLALVALLVCRWQDRRRHRHIADSMASAADADFAPLGETRRVELTTTARDFV